MPVAERGDGYDASAATGDPPDRYHRRRPLTAMFGGRQPHRRWPWHQPSIRARAFPGYLMRVVTGGARQGFDRHCRLHARCLPSTHDVQRRVGYATAHTDLCGWRRRTSIATMIEEPRQRREPVADRWLPYTIRAKGYARQDRSKTVGPEFSLRPNARLRPSHSAYSSCMVCARRYSRSSRRHRNSVPPPAHRIVRRQR